VSNEHIIFAFDMRLNQSRHSTSLATVEIIPAEGGARLIFTEQAAFLGGTDGAAGITSPDRGAADHLDRLGEVLRRKEV
jgi:hypothetical protein